MDKKEVGAATPEEVNTNTNGFKDINSFDAEAVAKDVLKNGDPMKYILDTFNMIHVGDRRIAELMALSVGSTCIKNCAGLHPKLSGASGKGKSHAGKTMLHLIPKQYSLHTSLSGKALYYHDIQPGTIVFSDDLRLSEELETLVKQSTGDFQLGVEHHTVDTNRTGQVLTVPPRIVWWLASVSDDLDMQTLNRQVGVGVDDSPETDALVLKHHLAMALSGEQEFPDSDEVAVCRVIFDTIKKLFVSVVLPFADRIEWMGGGNRRNAPIFLDMIKVYTLFNYRQRIVDDIEGEGSPTIYADEADFHAAASLYQDRAESQTTKLEPNELKVVDFLSSYGSADVGRIAQAIQLTYQTTRHLLIGRTNGNGGLLGKVTGLTVSDISRETDGGSRRTKEYSLVGYDRLASYSKIVTLVQKED